MAEWEEPRHPDPGHIERHLIPLSPTLQHHLPHEPTFPVRRPLRGRARTAANLAESRENFAMSSFAPCEPKRSNRRCAPVEARQRCPNAGSPAATWRVRPGIASAHPNATSTTAADTPNAIVKA